MMTSVWWWPSLFDQDGRLIKPQERLGGGGEGQVFALAGDPERVVKVFAPHRRTPNKMEKLLAMLKHPPVGAHGLVDGFPVLTWPQALVFADRHTQDVSTFVGYVMPRIATEDFVPLFQITSGARRRRLGGVPVTWDRLVTLAARLTHLVRTLHRFGYAIGDLNDRNVLVSRKFTPLLMDNDSFEVPRRPWGRFPSTVGDQMYWPPELLGVNLSTHRKSRRHGDRFALATLLFQLFMDGHRPYQARGSAVAAYDTLMEKTQAGRYPWYRPRPGVLEPPASAPDIHSLPKAIQRAFYDAFVSGHGHPSRRPSARRWYRVLVKTMRKGFRTCAVDEVHRYAPNLATCPWCTPPASKTPIRIPWRRPVAWSAWLGLLVLLFAVPVVWLLALPAGPEKRIVTGVVSTLAVAGPGIILSQRYFHGRGRWVVGSVWIGASTTGAALVSDHDGAILAWVAGIVAAVGGALVAAWMLRRRGLPLRPTGMSAMLSLAAAPLAWLPALVIWAWGAWA